MKTRRLAVAALLCSVPFVVSACSSSDGGGSNSTAGTAGASGGAGGASGGAAGTSGGTAGASGGAAGSSAASGFPNIDLAADARTLTPTQAGELCDWIDNSLGGYGLHTDCGPKSISNDANQAACISNRLAFTCKVTVGQVKTCITAEVPSRYCEVDSTACGPLSCQ
jgi:hypothetical protein